MKNIDILFVDNAKEGINQAKDRLLTYVSDTLLFLSGGKTPKELYRQLALEKKLQVGAVAMTDERIGLAMHEDSNEKMIKDTGLLGYLEGRGIPFYPILELPSEYEETALRYEVRVKALFKTFSKRIGIFGIGNDGHTAGLPALSSKLKTQNSKLYKTKDLVISHDEVIGGVRGRISVTFNAMEQLDLLLVMVFGEDKKWALEQMLQTGLEAEIPARFFMRPDIAPKTLLITDQMV